MKSAPDAGARAINSIARAEWGRLLASLIGSLGDFQLAEDCLQDAVESALVHWPRGGVPRSPAAWLLVTARRKAIDRIRHGRNFERKSAEYARLIEMEHETSDMFSEGAAAREIPDERLRLIFTCCHPALDQKTRVALTLRTLCGLTTAEIARAFLDSEEAMAQRLARARRKISKAGIPYQVPGPEAWPERLQSVLSVIYLVFNEGYSATAGENQLRAALCEEAIRLARVMAGLKAGEPEISGLLALMLLNHARRAARSGEGGQFIPLDRQDRSLWDRALIKEGVTLLEQAAAKRQPGVYQLQAAISAVHAEAASSADTRWLEIVRLYDGLHELSANPVYVLNRAVALSYAENPGAALAALLAVEAELDAYQPFHAARADFLRRLGRHSEARAVYSRAVSLSGNASERTFLEERAASLPQDSAR